jgi:uncharacterized paraquat-inducible protein A
MPLREEAIRTGETECPYCRGVFEATAFDAPQRAAVPQVQLAGAGPEADAACAMHARNAAVTSCQRCGLYICALCDMNIGTGSFCPPCFERVRTEGELQRAARRYRDYASMARTAVIVGLLFSFVFLGLPFGALGIYYGLKGLKQRRAEGKPRTGVMVAIVLGVLECLGGIATIGAVLYGIWNA